MILEKNKVRIFRSSHQSCYIEKSVLKIFAKFTGKHLCQSLFLIKLQACLFEKNYFTEHLRATAFESYIGLSWKNDNQILKIQRLGLLRRSIKTGSEFLLLRLQGCCETGVIVKVKHQNRMKKKGSNATFVIFRRIFTVELRILSYI